MFFFGKNLQSKHKVTLCLVLVGILANVYLWSTLPQMQFIEIIPEHYNSEYIVTHIVVAFVTFINCIVLCIFRKF